MLIHIRPAVLAGDAEVSLVDVTFEPFGLRLRAGTELAARRPYPNKNYLVACPAKGRKAVDGLFVATGRPVKEFQCVTRWAISAERLAVHRVTYRLLDGDFDTATACMNFWSAQGGELGGWPSRWPQWAEGHFPLSVQPAMALRPIEAEASQPERQSGAAAVNRRDIYDAEGWIVERSETFAMPTIERERLFDPRVHPYPGRLPPLESAFSV